MLRHRAVIQYYEFMVTDGKSMFGFLIKVGNISSLNDVLTVFEICKETLRNKAFPIQATCQLKKHEKADVLLLCVEPCETAENLLKMNEDLSHNLSAVLPGITSEIDAEIPENRCHEFKLWADSLQSFGNLFNGK